MTTDRFAIQLTQPVTPTPLRFGQYLLIRKLAEGGMAEIYLAKQVGAEGFERDVVVKLMLPHFSTSREFIDMFLDEARLAAKLHHPNIVQITDLGVAEGRYYITMEYLAGEDVQSIIERASHRQRPVPLAIAAKIIFSACEGLEFAHGYSEGGKPVNLVHRDISPSNILVTYQGTVKVVDFGIAKASSKLVKTDVGTVKGKWGYMSPEQARGEPLDARSDLFSLGVTFYELLTGQRVFQRDNELAVLIAMMNQPVVAPSAVRPDIPAALDRIVLRCLSRDRAERYPNTAALRTDLEQYLTSTSSIPGSSQLSMFMLELFGQEHADRKTQVPSLSELAAAPTVPPVEAGYGTERTFVRPSGANLAVIPAAAAVAPPPTAPSTERGVVPKFGRSDELPLAPAKPARNLLLWIGVPVALVAFAAAGYLLRPPPPVPVVTTPPVVTPVQTPVVVTPPKVPDVETEPKVAPDPVVVPEDPVKDPPKEIVKAARPIGPKDVGAVLSRSRKQITGCGEKFRADLPPDRLVKVILGIKRSGAVSEAQASTPGVSGTPLGKCLTGVIKGLKFPRNSNDPELQIELPLRFTGE